MGNEISKQKILILGAGYGGVVTAQGLAKIAHQSNIEVTIVNKHTYHQMLTKIHEPAGGYRDPDEVRIPLNKLLPNNIKIVKDTVEKILPEEKKVVLTEQELSYDYLIVALGSDPEYYGIEGMEEHAFTLRSLNAARLIKARIEVNMARYKTETGLDRNKYLNFVIGGAGFTGVELAGELAEWVPRALPKYDIPYRQVRLISVEAAPTVMPGFDPELSKKAEEILREKGVEVYLGKPIKKVTEEAVWIGDEKIPTRTMIWTGGVRGNSLLEQCGFTTQRGCANIKQTLQSVDFENVFIIGDSSLYYDDQGRRFPPTAQIAMQQGKHLSDNFKRLFSGQNLLPFKYINRGVVVSIGEKHALGVLYGKYKVVGFLAVQMKKLVHYRYLITLGGLKITLLSLLGLLPKTNYKETSKNLNSDE